MVMFQADAPFMDKFITEYAENQVKEMPEEKVAEREAFMDAMQNDIKMTYEGAETAKREYERVEKMLDENKKRLLNEQTKKIQDDDDEDFMDEPDYHHKEL